MPLQATSGAASYDAFGGGVAVLPKYIEDYFSTYLTTGTSSTLIVNNGIDLAGKGGLVWQKGRNSVVGATSNTLFDTARGVNQLLQTNSTSAQINAAGTLTSFNSNGFEIGSNNNLYISGQTGVNWVWAKAPKFFDVVTYTGTGSNFGNDIAHSLGSLPGFLIFKATSTTSNWCCLAQNSSGNYEVLQLDTVSSSFGAYSPTTSQVTTTTFNPGKVWGNSANASGQTYVAYLFASNAGGFGLTGTDNVISCGSCTGGSGTTVTLGYEPQWLLIKKTNAAQDWFLMDNMRGLNAKQGDQALSPNTTGAEPTASSNFNITSTGFVNAGLGTGSDTYIYIAIRRGPMKVPTDGTKVFATTVATVTTSSNTIVASGSVAAPDMTWLKDISNASAPFLEQMRLTGDGYLASGGGYANGILTTTSGYTTWDRMFGTKPYPWASGDSCITYAMQRAPSFMDVVCYTGSSSTKQQSHNLGVVPEMMFVKALTGPSAQYWNIYHSAIGSSKYLQLGENASPGTDAAATSTSPWNANTPTVSVFYVGPTTVANYPPTNSNNYTYVAYLFASCPGVSKVFSFTGNGSTQTINCGFTGGARFVLLKASSATGGWYVYDTARGMTTLTDPYLQLNSTAAESATLGSVTTVTTGFAVNESVLAGVNTNGVTYIGLAIA